MRDEETRNIPGQRRLRGNNSAVCDPGFDPEPEKGYLWNLKIYWLVASIVLVLVSYIW